jgi:FkbM family methyltransferase
MTAYIYKEVFADADYDLPLEVQNPVILDIGANTGLFSLRMKQLYPDAQIACFEPEPGNFSQLQSLITQNQLQGVKAYKKAIGAETKTSTLFLHPRNIGGHSLIQQEADWVPVEVELLSLSDALQAFPGNVCHLMKLDCEGAEYEIIRGIDATLAKRIRCIVFEGSGQLYDVNELHQHLKMLGYNLEHRRGLTIARLAAA